MFDIEGLRETKQQTTRQMGAGSLMFASSKDNVILVQATNRQFVCAIEHRNATDRILKYLAKLELPPPPKRLRAMAGMRPAVGWQLSEEKRNIASRGDASTSQKEHQV